jgi:nitrite reductase/ring-hydroxylating ferredoxin subunit
MEAGIKRNFGGFYAATAVEPDAELTRVGPGTPCGGYLRRFWQPIALAEEVKDLPLAIRVLGEDLVLFRDLSGRIGLLHRQCSHRGASLEFGRVSDRGIRCCYHGWKYDIDGTVLETPGEPEASNLRDTLFHGAYMTREYSGLIFAYMGPPDEVPEFPMLDTFTVPADNRLVPYKLEQPSNWLQAHENGADAIHSAFLHGDYGANFTPVFAALPTIDFFETPIGLLAIAVRRWNENLYVRASDVFLPNFAQFGSGYINGEYEKFAFGAWTTRWIVPIDDTHCWTIGLRHVNSVMDPHGDSNLSLIGLGKVDLPGQTGDRSYEERQRNPGDWDAQVSQGPIAVHGNEYLGTTDRGIILLRRRLRANIRALAQGLKPAPEFGASATPTYIHEIVLRVPPRPGSDDGELRRSFGRAVARIVIDSGTLQTDKRGAEVERRVRALAFETSLS